MQQEPKWIETNKLERIGAVACTVFPIGVFVQLGYYHGKGSTLAVHEGVHWNQQRRWYEWASRWMKCGWIGLIAWYWLYLVGLPLGLPFIWNPWRVKWEVEAMRAAGRSDDKIVASLRSRPYFILFGVKRRLNAS